MGKNLYTQTIYVRKKEKGILEEMKKAAKKAGKPLNEFIFDLYRGATKTLVDCEECNGKGYKYETA